MQCVPRLRKRSDAVGGFGRVEEHVVPPDALNIALGVWQDMREINKGIGVDNLHYLTDGLWKLPRLDG